MPRWRARALIRIHPDAKAVTGSGKRRDQRSFNAAALRLIDDLSEQVGRLERELAELRPRES